ncbi:MAG TPA: YraN family protein [Ferrovibrio sp.]|uniref:YraN family protein n=1 Tax=Ferrovibrio sp. TaxID=1917215 RepID=UPI002B4ABFDC|nr:YraN family protein [Ferrovibrio sp.]HLT77958.1 YraN family protein [Ferrovibrio sp.]
MTARAAHLLRGRRGERLAAFWLRLQGFRILARNWRHPAGEVDILARRGNLLVAVEVKWRASLDAAAESILRQQRHRIANAAAVFLSRQPDAAKLRLRFDAVLLMPGRLPRHVRDAWRP